APKQCNSKALRFCTIAQVGFRIQQIRVVQNIEGVRAQRHPGLLAELLQRECSRYREIQVGESRPSKRVPSSIPVVVVTLGNFEGGGVQELYPAFLRDPLFRGSRF